MKKEQLERLVNYTNQTTGDTWTVDNLRNYSAPADIIQFYPGSAYDDEAIKNLLIELLDNLFDSELLELYREANERSQGLFDFVDYYENDEDFFNEHFTSPAEAVRAALFGNYRYNDDYVRFDGYENLRSFNESELMEAAREYITDLANYILLAYKDFSATTGNDDIDGFIELLEDIESEEE
jgi:hypothetical protein